MDVAICDTNENVNMTNENVDDTNETVNTTNVNSEHVNNLKKLCRVCGSKIGFKLGYQKAKCVDDFSEIISKVYNIDVTNEDESIYPKKLCGSCKRKLERLMKKTVVENAIPYIFNEHQDGECNICQQTTVSSSNIGFTSMDEHFKKAGFIKLDNPDYRRVYLLHEFNCEKIVQKLSIFIKNNNEWTCHIFGYPVSKEHQVVGSLPVVLDKDNIDPFVNFFTTVKLCPGIKGFADVVSNRLEINIPFQSKDGSKIANVENSLHQPLISEDYMYIRHSNCCLISNDGKMCENCLSYRNSIYQFRPKTGDEEPQKKKSRTDPSSKTNYKYLTREELIERLNNIQKEKKEIIRKLTKSLKAVRKSISKEGVNVENDQHQLFQQTINNHEQPFDEQSPQGLLWQEQKHQASLKDSRGMRWHPLIIRWCLSIHYASEKAYKQLKSKKLDFLRLPHINTLRRYSQFTTPSAGFNPDVIKQLIKQSNLSELKPYQKCVAISFDEMQIKSDLVYRKSTGQMIGFTDMGDINEEFRIFQNNIENSEEKSILRDFATHVIVYMARGIFTDLQYPFGYYASTGMTSAQLYPCTMEAVRVLSSIGFDVRALVSDGASPNRKFYKMMLVEQDELYWTLNPFEDEILYNFSDEPHLLKTTRNCFENSGFNKDSRNLHVSVFTSIYTI